MVCLHDDPAITADYTMKIECKDKQPTSLSVLGNNDGCRDTKEKLAVLARPWEGRVKHLVNKCELVDIMRGPTVADRIYNRSIINYDADTTSNHDPLEYRDALTPVFSRSYFKLWEILSVTNVLGDYKDKNMRVANLCEGPGGFIQCLLNFRKMQKEDPGWKDDSYTAITLNVAHSQLNSSLDWSYHKAKSFFDKLEKHGYQVYLSYGTGDGNIQKIETIEHFAEKDLEGKKCELVTADGGVDMNSDEDYNAQELANAKLFYAQIVAAVSVQEKGGTFIMKIYDIYTIITVQLLAILRAHYSSVTVLSLLASRTASSEKYVVCSGFRGISAEKIFELKQCLLRWLEAEPNNTYVENKEFVTSLLEYKPMPESPLVRDLQEINKRHYIRQKTTLEEGLSLITSGKLNDDDVTKRYKLRQRNAAEQWCLKYAVPYIRDLPLSKLTPIKMSLPSLGSLEN